MIRSSMVFTGILFLFCAPLGADEYTLTFERAVHNPVAFFGTAPIETGEKGNGWIKGDEFLTENATSVIAHLAMGDAGFAAFLLSVDMKSDEADKPDTLYIDLNRNRTLDEGETLPLVLVDNKGAGPEMPFTLLSAEKVAYCDKDTDESATFHVNFYYPIIEEAPPGFGIAFGLSAWGCCTGQVMLDDVAYDVTLEDRTVNGSFSDFDEGERFDCDCLTFHRADEQKAITEMTPPPPLRHKMLIGDQAYAVAVKENGRLLSLDPIAIETGTVLAGAPELAVNLSNPDWGSFRIAPGESRDLPAGEWTIVDYAREKTDRSSVCTYSEPTEKSVIVTKGETVRLDLATALVAKVSAKCHSGTVRLGLAMTTAGGARMQGYFSSTAGRSGIPFHITNSAGETVEKGTFEFG